MKLLQAALFLGVGVCLAGCDATATDSEIVQKIIANSIAGYRGSCPCPYSINNAGNQCGNTSAYSQAGGAAPICYPNQVTAEMIKAWRGF